MGSYRAVITVVLSKNKITVEEKRMLRGFRRTFSITDEVGLSAYKQKYLQRTQEHRKILKEFDWTEDQYEDGEKVTSFFFYGIFLILFSFSMMRT